MYCRFDTLTYLRVLSRAGQTNPTRPAPADPRENKGKRAGQNRVRGLSGWGIRFVLVSIGRLRGVWIAPIVTIPEPKLDPNDIFNPIQYNTTQNSLHINTQFFSTETLELLSVVSSFSPLKSSSFKVHQLPNFSAQLHNF